MSEQLVYRVGLGAPVPVVHHALTEAAALRVWLAEHAEVDLPERYAFWGRSTPAGRQPRQRPLHVDDTSLSFAWPLDDEEITVNVVLAEESADTTILSLSWSPVPPWPELVAETSTRAVLLTYWALSLANLSDHLDGRPLTPRCDFTSPRMREEFLIGAPARAVYDSMVDPATFRRWFGANVEIEPRVGGRWAMGGLDRDDSPATIIAMEPGRGMTLAWRDGLVAAWTVEDVGGGARLTFEQRDFDERRPPYGAWMGWLSGLAELRRFHEVPNWRPIVRDLTVPGMPEGLITND
ncbi:putative conserved protein YndB, AHSA1/START domain [Streptoalloteichus tenebrarius]|uniref:Conserved protein YndB, AHSA1/START domain n=1 Tax=Streptoalloteichus tenebrarius (strain ATCC 17920 / DSM 40477 / JCM 4838 / CBS 697.72 / NBRC 16177 / NCIMB 11028 / NRRL B-12390 / A12253. 1 / ISP 5477) TaxID=1933 RepID=A0ABT1HPT6_STRSD|nr:SRPBCC domain-containing protein [Streptoalloteichus tenebrarius]MCP2257526.1 putative conserved protein YndB, AHSA1/START domain [Streptoalloteichus tenebrarius]BFE98477.1 hypothetical protein GCM10020241_01530 [Streptoalloteichus tenebrarius]